MAAEADWTIRPREGLGRLTFGMSPAQVDSLSATYGTVTGRGADRVADGMLRETLEMFGDAMSDDEKQAFIAEYADNGPPADSVTETRGGYADTEAAFDDLAISVNGFGVIDSTTGVLALDDSDERFRERTATLREVRYLPEHEMHRYALHSLRTVNDRPPRPN